MMAGVESANGTSFVFFRIAHHDLAARNLCAGWKQQAQVRFAESSKSFDELSRRGGRL
jgi:hypothetical protein